MNMVSRNINREESVAKCRASGGLARSCVVERGRRCSELTFLTDVVIEGLEMFLVTVIFKYS